MNKIRSLLFGFLIFGALGVGYLTINRQMLVKETVLPETQIGGQAEEGKQEVNLVVDFGDERIEESEELVEGETAFSLLQKVVEKKEIKMETKQYDFGVFVQSIDGHESGTDLAWIYFINGESGSRAADQYELTTGDRVEWKYIRPEF